VSVAEIGKLYDASDAYNIRSQIISVLASRKEPEASDKLIDIVKNSTVNSLRSQAINALVNKKDQRAQQMLLDLVGKP
jgi:HEAT repeat protein